MSADQRLPPASGIYLKETGTVRGRGVFALRRFDAGEVVEVCPVVILDSPYGDLPLTIQRLVFNWRMLASANGNTYAIALGFGTLYNSANPANLRYHARPDDHALVFTAVRQIEPDEELTINYSGERGVETSDKNWWFERTKVEMK